MEIVDFVSINDVAIGLLVSEEGRKCFWAASYSLQSVDGMAFDDVEETKAFVLRRLRSQIQAQNIARILAL